MHYETVAPDTWAVIAGRGAQTPGSPLNVPPVLASNFVLGGDRAYARDEGTPTWEAFEEGLGGLEHGVAVAFASGMAAAAAILDLLPADANVVLPDDCYQAVVSLAAAGQELGRWSVTRLAPDDTQGWLRAAEHADLVWLECPRIRFCTSPTCPPSSRTRARPVRSPSSTTPSPHRSGSNRLSRRRPRPALGDEIPRRTL